jgi:hypothetical protein
MTHIHNHLAAYMNDHLTGSTTVIDLLEDLERARTGKDVGLLLAELRGDVIADRLTMEALMEHAQIGKSPYRRAAAWLAEKVTQLKLRLDDPVDGTLYLLEALELVEVGIEGKRALWRALAAAADHVPRLQGINYDHLIRRAEEQLRRVETVRLEAAKTAFATAV